MECLFGIRQCPQYELRSQPSRGNDTNYDSVDGRSNVTEPLSAEARRSHGATSGATQIKSKFGMLPQILQGRTSAKFAQN